MTITKSVEIPANNRSITLDIPPEIPAGKVIITFTPVTETNSVGFVDASYDEVMVAGDEILDKHIAAFKALAK